MSVADRLHCFLKLSHMRHCLHKQAPWHWQPSWWQAFISDASKWKECWSSSRKCFSKEQHHAATTAKSNLCCRVSSWQPKVVDPCCMHDDTPVSLQTRHEFDDCIFHLQFLQSWDPTGVDKRKWRKSDFFFFWEAKSWLTCCFCVLTWQHLQKVLMLSQKLGLLFWIPAASQHWKMQIIVGSSCPLIEWWLREAWPTNSLSFSLILWRLSCGSKVEKMCFLCHATFQWHEQILCQTCWTVSHRCVHMSVGDNFFQSTNWQVLSSLQCECGKGKKKLAAVGCAGEKDSKETPCSVWFPPQLKGGRWWNGEFIRGHRAPVLLSPNCLQVFQSPIQHS